MRGPARFVRYHEDPEQTALAIDADGWFHSGDLGRLDEEGRLSFVGRLKDMLKVGGENVAASEIETFLLTHPACEIVQVVSAPDARYTEVAAAFVQLRAGHEATEEELIDFCLGSIATFKVPRYIRFVDAKVADVGHEDPEVQAPRADRRRARAGGHHRGAEAPRARLIRAALRVTGDAAVGRHPRQRVDVLGRREQRADVRVGEPVRDRDGAAADRLVDPCDPARGGRTRSRRRPGRRRRRPRLPRRSGWMRMFAGSRSSTDGQVAPVRVDAPPVPARDQDERRRLPPPPRAGRAAARAPGSSARPGGCCARPSRASDPRRRARVGAALSSSNVARADGRTRRRRRSSSVVDVERQALRQDRRAEALAERRERPPAGPAVGADRHDRRACTGPRAPARGSPRSAAGRRARAGRRRRGRASRARSCRRAGRPRRRRRECCSSAARTRRASGSAESRLPPSTKSAWRLPASISSSIVIDGYSPPWRGSSGRLGGPGSGPGSGVPGRLSSPWTKPGLNQTPPGRSSEPGDGEERDREPLGEVRGRRHRGAGARLQGEAAVAPHRGEEVASSSGREAGDPDGGGLASKRSTAVRSSSTRVACAARYSRSAPSRSSSRTGTPSSA